MRILEIVTETMKEALDDPLLSGESDFFEAGGDSMIASLVVVALRRRLSLAVPIDAVQLCPTPASLAQLLTGLTGIIDGERAVVGGVFPLSRVQEAIREAMALWKPAGVYNVPAVYRITGFVDRRRLASCLQRATMYHEASRAVLVDRQRTGGLIIADEVDLQVCVAAGYADEPTAMTKISAFLNEYIDPAADIPIRALIAQDTDRADNKAAGTYLAVSATHLIFDGETLGDYLLTVAALYNGRADLPPGRRLHRMEVPRPADEEASTKPSSRVSPWTRLSFQQPRVDILDPAGSRQAGNFTPQQVYALSALARKHAATTYEIIVTLIWILCARGTLGPIRICGAYKQPSYDGQGMRVEGMSTSLKALQLGEVEDLTFAAAVRHTAQVIRQSQSGSEGAIIDEAPPIVVALQDSGAEDFFLNGTENTLLDWGNGTARFEVAILLHLSSKRPRIILEYMQQCCGDADVASYIEMFFKLADKVITDQVADTYPDIRVTQLIR